MDFELTDDQKMLAETVASFTKQNSPVERFRELRDDDTGWEAATWRHMGDLGWLSVPFPEEVGGFGGSFVEVCQLLEKLGRTLVPEPYLASVVLGGMALLRAGSGEQHGRWLTPMLEGRTSLALAYAERDRRFAVTAPGTRAERHDRGWKVTGEKVFVLNGHAADQILVSASTDAGATLFVLDRGSKGLDVRPIKTMDGHHAALVRVEGAFVEDDRMLGAPGSAGAVLDHVMDYGATAAVAEGAGLGRAVLDLTVEHLRTREQFGVAIGTFQVLQHHTVDMFVELELIRSMMMMASVKVDGSEEDERRRSVSAAKAHLAAGGKLITQQSIQLHGGIGITDEHDIGLYFKRMHVLNTLFGDEQHHLGRFASLPSFRA